MSFASDTFRTSERFEQLHGYMDQNVLAPSGRFICSNGRDCCRSVLADRAGRLRPDRVFTPGQLSHVGRRYDLSEEGRALRILVIPMDTGGTDGRIQLEARREAVGRSAALDYRARNAHMRGTMNALRLAVGREPGTDAEGEWLALANEPTPVHLFDCFAMANLHLCSATRPGSNESKTTRMMSDNCLGHLAKTIEILEPTLCIVQSVRVAAWLNRITANPAPVTEHLAWGHVAGVETLIAAFVHPSYQRRIWHWGHVETVPYLWNVVRPTIRRARQELGLSVTPGN